MRLEQFEMLEELGRGGFGVVYKAREKASDKIMAVKVLHPTLVNDPAFISRFRREAEVAGKLEHSNMVPVYGYGASKGRYYILMAYMPGGSLKDMLKAKGAFSSDKALTVFEQIAVGLAFAHGKNVVHRDLKPGNILFDDDGKARISDLGFAKLLRSDMGTSITMSGGLIGTPAYMAPEIWKGEPASPASDVYSCACILVEMLSGERLFEGEITPEVMYKHFQPLQLPDNLPPGWRPIITRGLAADPADRPAIDLFASELAQPAKAIPDPPTNRVEPFLPTTGKFIPLGGEAHHEIAHKEDYAAPNSDTDVPQVYPLLPVTGRYFPLDGKEFSKTDPGGWHADSETDLHQPEPGLPVTGRFFPLTGENRQQSPPTGQTAKPIILGLPPWIGVFNQSTINEPSGQPFSKNAAADLPPWVQPRQPDKGWFTPAGDEHVQASEPGRPAEPLLEELPPWLKPAEPSTDWFTPRAPMEEPFQTANDTNSVPIYLKVLVGVAAIIAVLLSIQAITKWWATQVYYAERTASALVPERNPTATVQAVAANPQSTSTRKAPSIPEPQATNKPTSAPTSTKAATQTPTAPTAKITLVNCGRNTDDNCVSQSWPGVTFNFKSTTLQVGKFTMQIGSRSVSCNTHTWLANMFTCTATGLQLNTTYNMTITDKDTGREIASGNVSFQYSFPTSRYDD